MGLEIEAKMKLADPAALERQLVSLGATRGPVLLETNTFFDTPERALREADRGLRIRVERDEATGESRAIVTHKGPLAPGPLKTRPETEVVVADAQAAADLLAALGYEAVLTFEKRRARWDLAGCHVELDRLPLLRDFVEIEGPDEASVMAVRERLGLGGEPLIRTGYIGLLKEELARRGSEARVVRLADE